MIVLRTHALGSILTVRAQPGARKNAVLGERSGALRIAVSAAPEKGKANAAILVVLADALGCKASQVSLLSGETSRDKTFLVSGIDLEDLRTRVDALTQQKPGDRTADDADGHRLKTN